MTTHYSSQAWKLVSWLGVSDTLAILRILESVLTTSSVLALHKAFDILAWLLIKRDTGVRTIHLLGLSSVTGISGTFGILFSKHARGLERITAATKLVLLTMIWVSGILLFAKTEVISVNSTIYTYAVTAGIGPFRSAYVDEYLGRLQAENRNYEHTLLPYSIMATAANLINNPIYSTATDPISCSPNERCSSFLMPGGLVTSTPWPPVGRAEYPTITIYHAPATQIDFVRILEQPESFNVSRDCLVYGSDGQDGFRVAMQFCLARSKTKRDALEAGKWGFLTYVRWLILSGLFVCGDGIQNGDCKSSTNPARLMATFSIYQRHATITSARLNMSITAVREITTPHQLVEIDIDALKQSFTWLFNSTAANIPAPSSPAQFFWTAQSQLQDEYTSIAPYQLFQSLLAFPFWHFNDNNFGNVRLGSQNITTSLPEEFYTTAAVDKPMDKISVNG